MIPGIIVKDMSTKLSQPTADWKARGDRLDFHGRKIFAARLGYGATKLLCLHAFPTSSFDYSRVIPLLSSQFEFILFDYLGYGFSDKPRGYNYSLSESADTAEFVANHFDLHELNILAHDIGDSVALELLTRTSVNASKLMLLNGSVWSISFKDWSMLIPQRLTLNPLTGPWFSYFRLFNRFALKRFFDRIFFAALSPAEIDSFWSLVAYNDGARNYHLLMRYMNERWKYQTLWLDALKTHPAKVGALWGLDDPVATPEVLEVLERYRPDIVSTRLKDTGHYPHWERPEESARAIRDFFAG
jgi:pimeloyl-ACP methyl ester carboxylesterase